MVTQQQLDSIRDNARLFPLVDRLELRNGLLSALREGLPDWTPDYANSLLGRATRYMAANVQVALETNHSQLFRGLIATAEGNDLDLLGLGPPPVIRQLNEDDDPYRIRIINAYSQLNLGSLPGVEERSRNFNSTIVNVRAVVAPNRQNLAVYVIGADAMPIADIAPLRNFLNGRATHIAGVETAVVAPTVKRYRIRTTAIYDTTLFGAVEIEAAVRESLNTYVTNNYNIGSTIYSASMCEASWVPGLVDSMSNFIVPTTGNDFAEGDDGVVNAGNLVARESYTVSDLWYCPADTDNIIITTQEAS